MDELEFAALLRSQAGTFTRSQAINLGMCPRDATLAIKNQLWIPAAGHGFVPAGHELGLVQLAWSAMLSMPGSLVWGAVALKLWCPKAPFPEPSTVDVAVSSKRRPQFRIRPHAIKVADDERADWHGLAMQSRPAALADALATLDERVADSLFAWSVTRRLATADEMFAQVARLSRTGRAAAVRRYAEMWRLGAASRAEVLFHVLMDRHGISGWVPNIQVRLSDGTMYSPDVLFEDLRLAIEIDGWGSHGHRDAFENDRVRQNSLILDGYHVLRFTWRALTERPDECAEQVKTMLRNLS
jgi:very-short-patch-repair endonuclease